MVAVPVAVRLQLMELLPVPLTGPPLVMAIVPLPETPTLRLLAQIESAPSTVTVPVAPLMLPILPRGRVENAAAVDRQRADSCVADVSRCGTRPGARVGGTDVAGGGDGGRRRRGG